MKSSICLSDLNTLASIKITYTFLSLSLNALLIKVWIFLSLA